MAPERAPSLAEPIVTRRLTCAAHTKHLHESAQAADDSQDQERPSVRRHGALPHASPRECDLRWLRGRGVCRCLDDQFRRLGARERVGVDDEVVVGREFLSDAVKALEVVDPCGVGAFDRSGGFIVG
jgi:hypothetical protein